MTLEREWFTIAPEVEQDVRFICERTGRKKSEVYREALLMYIKLEMPPILERELQRTALKMAAEQV